MARLGALAWRGLRHGRARPRPGGGRLRGPALELGHRPGVGTAVTDVGVGVVELLRAVTRPGDAVAISPPSIRRSSTGSPKRVRGSSRSRSPSAADGSAWTWTASWPSAWCRPARPGIWPGSNAPPWSPRHRPWHRSSRPLPPDTRWRIGHLGVIAAVAAYTEGESWPDQLLRTLDHRRLVLGDLLAEQLPAISWQPPEATFLAWLDFATSVDILDQATKGMARAIAG